MTEIFKMPDIGEGMAEGDITNWLVEVGDQVAVDDSVAEVQNDKLMQEILSPYAGKVTKLFVDPNTTVSVGDPLIEFDGDGTGGSSDVKPKQEQVPKQDEATTVNVTEATPTSNQVEVKSPVMASNGQILAMPSVRHYAAEHQIDLNQVLATGRHGHITLQDVQNFFGSTVSQNKTSSTETTNIPVSNPIAEVEAKPTPIVHAPETKEGRQPMTGVRKAIAKAMAHQNETIPTVTNFDSIEVSKLVQHRKTFKDQMKEQGINLTYLAYAVKAMAAVGKKFPELNSSLDMNTKEIVYHNTVNMGIAVNAPAGLYVPVIAHAESKSIQAIAQEISELAEAVRNNSIKPAQMQGGTMTISNLGSARGTWFTPIINGQEVMILGLGSILKEPIVDAEGELSIGQNMKLSLSYDHRLIDGMLAQNAMNYLKQLLADPAFMLMEV